VDTNGGQVVHVMFGLMCVGREQTMMIYLLDRPRQAAPLLVMSSILVRMEGLVLTLALLDILIFMRAVSGLMKNRVMTGKETDWYENNSVTTVYTLQLLVVKMISVKLVLVTTFMLLINALDKFSGECRPTCRVLILSTDTPSCLELVERWALMMMAFSGHRWPDLPAVLASESISHRVLLR
jgi:hypothetical protein